MNATIGRLLALVALYLLVSLTSSATGATHNVLHFRPGLHLSKEQPVTNEQIKRLVKGLRFWTGFNQIGIDAVGDVTLGDRADVSNGSASARQLMMAACRQPRPRIIMLSHSRAY